ncbi:ABC transporter permease [Consotaella aegiceratis]|uniref:ABC transporter permease n=1 Tax=Consotaella aegiceratis TaxID=3097961 RepID=UPI002F3FB04F
MAATTGAIEGTDAASVRHSRRGYWPLVWRRLRRDPISMLSLFVLLAIVFGAIFAPWITPYDPNHGDILSRLKAPGTPGHILGTDATGRDLYTRLVWGGRLSMLSGTLPVIVATLIGGTLGIVAGMSGRIVNTIIMRIVDVLFAFPSILLAVAISGILGNGLDNTLIALSIVFTPQVVRVAESATVQISRQDFVDAARATGASQALILRAQILPNVLSQILVFATSLIAVGMVVAAGLNFIGLGIAPPAAEWGSMLNELRDAIYINPVLSVLPGVLIVATSICFNLLSDGLRSAMNIREVS